MAKLLIFPFVFGPLSRSYLVMIFFQISGYRNSLLPFSTLLVFSLLYTSGAGDWPKIQEKWMIPS